jgi:ADP-heptose:LPS heptosyltransferase
MTSQKALPFKEFVLFSAGPLGDHAIELDYANRFYESTDIPSVIVYKNNYSFLKDLALPYLDHVSRINYQSISGKLSLGLLVLSSIFRPRCFILWVPIRYPASMKAIVYFIRFLTVSRFVGLDVNEKTPYGDFSKKSSLYFLGKKNLIRLNSHSELFYEQENRMLTFLGFDPVLHVPKLEYVFQPQVFEKLDLSSPYIAVHLVGSAGDRSLPVQRWRSILIEIQKQNPGYLFLFTGSEKDKTFIEEVLAVLSPHTYKNTGGKVNLQELLTLYAKAACCLTVHTGNAMFINMLHARSVVVNIVGNYMYQYHFNQHAIVLFEKRRCICNRESIDCFIDINGKKYMKCMYDILDENIVQAVNRQINTQKY